MNIVPNYVLYGESSNDIFPDYLHIESIRSRSIHNAWKFRLHQHHNMHQFFYINNGGGSVVINKIKYELNDDQFIGIPPLMVHGFHFSPDTDGWVLTLPQSFLDNILSELPFAKEPMSRLIIHKSKDFESENSLKQIFNSINSIHQGMTQTRNFNLRCYMMLLVSKIIDTFANQNKISPSSLTKNQKFVNALQREINISFKKRLSVSEYALSMDITPTHLNRVCKSVLNLSPSELINERSLLEAKRFLSYTSMTISEISYELGFADLPHFSKFFLKRTQKSPSEYRNYFSTEK